MPGPSLQTRAVVIFKRPPTDAFQALSAFSGEHGLLALQQRIPKKPSPSHVALDLFDEADLSLESANEGRTWFVREARIVGRPEAIGRSYQALRFASALAALVARNPVQEDSWKPVASLLREAFAAFARNTRPDIVYLKSLFRFARDEGYPVREEWLSSLGRDDATLAGKLLNRPTGEEPASLSEVAALTGRLERYLRGRAEISLDET